MSDEELAERIANEGKQVLAQGVPVGEAQYLIESSGLLRLVKGASGNVVITCAGDSEWLQGIARRVAMILGITAVAVLCALVAVAVAAGGW